jgi:hypothetical protein
VVPTTEAAIREYLDKSTSTLPFDLSINYASDDDVTPKALVAVKYRPSFANAASASDTSSTEAILACDFYPEEMEIAYLRATEAAREAAENDGF